MKKKIILTILIVIITVINIILFKNFYKIKLENEQYNRMLVNINSL